jgi:hypothetical protein
VKNGLFPERDKVIVSSAVSRMAVWPTHCLQWIWVDISWGLEWPRFELDHLSSPSVCVICMEHHIESSIGMRRDKRVIAIINPAVPTLSQFMPPLVSQQFFHGTPRPKEIHITSIYQVVRSRQLNCYFLTA